jgi:hypothetical protein
LRGFLGLPAISLIISGAPVVTGRPAQSLDQGDAATIRVAGGLLFWF